MASGRVPITESTLLMTCSELKTPVIATKLVVYFIMILSLPNAKAALAKQGCWSFFAKLTSPTPQQETSECCRLLPAFVHELSSKRPVVTTLQIAPDRSFLPSLKQRGCLRL